MNWKTILIILTGVLLFTFSLIGVSVAAPAPKVDVCHLDDEGYYHQINVSQNALAAHLAHGDGQPAAADGSTIGSPVPGYGSVTGEGMFTAIGGNFELTLGGVGATFNADCSPTGPASGMLSWNRPSTNYMEADIVGDILFEFDSASFTVRPTYWTGVNVGGCDFIWTVYKNGDWVSLIAHSPNSTCPIIGQGNHGSSAGGTITIEPPF